MSLTAALILAILLLAVAEAPIFTVIGGLSCVLFYFAQGDFQALQTILIEMNRLASMSVLVALPLFTLSGCLLTETAAPQRIMELFCALMGWLPGGLAISALFSCALFTALTGASGVTIVALGSVLYPILRQKNYGEPFTLGLLTTSGSLGLLFPPSLPVILYGVVAQVDIARIFAAAFVPGVLLILVLSLYAYGHRALGSSETGEQRKGEAFSWQRVGRALWQAKWDWPILVIILVGVYGGFVTIAEVSALVLAYVIVVECLILREIRILQLSGIMVEAAVFSGAIIVILGMALGFTGYLVDEQIPNRILAWLTGMTGSRILFLGGLNLFLLAVGCIMDIFSAIVIIVPIIVPVAASYGIDPVHLCLIFLVNLEIGYSTPPVGINLFIASIRFKKPLALIYRASLPYLVLLLAVLLLVTYIPALSLFGQGG